MTRLSSFLNGISGVKKKPSGLKGQGDASKSQRSFCTFHQLDLSSKVAAVDQKITLFLYLQTSIFSDWDGLNTFTSQSETENSTNVFFSLTDQVLSVLFFPSILSCYLWKSVHSWCESKLIEIHIMARGNLWFHVTVKRVYCAFGTENVLNRFADKPTEYLLPTWL